MRNQAASEEWQGEDHNPIDEIEPEEVQENAYREAAMKMLVFLHAAFSYIHEARSKDEMAIRFWAVSSAIDHPACDGKSDLHIASDCSTTRANFSKHKLSFERQNNLPPTFSQKSVAARQSYRATRISQLNESGT